MATVHLSPVGNGFQFLSANVIPALALGKIYTYGAGSTTPQDTYTTLAGNVKNANPIQLNSDGRPPQEIWLVEGFMYRFDLKDSLGNLIQTLDNIYGINDLTVNSGLLPGSNVSFLQLGSGAVTRTMQDKVRESVSVLDFGAVADSGTIDNTAAVTAAIAAMSARGGGDVLFPQPNTSGNFYRCNSAISMLPRVRLVGQGVPPRSFASSYSNVTKLDARGGLKITAPASTSYQDFAIENLWIDGTNATGITSGLTMDATAAATYIIGVRLKDVAITNFPKHQVLQDGACFNIVHENLIANNANVAADDIYRVQNTLGFDAASQLHFVNPVFGQYTATKWCYSAIAQVVGLDFKGGTIANLAGGAGANGIDALGGITLVGTHMEGIAAQAATIGCRYVGSDGGVFMPSRLFSFGVGLKISGRGLTVGGSIGGYNVAGTGDIYITAGGIRYTTIVEVGYSNSSPTIVDDRLTIDGLREVIYALGALLSANHGDFDIARARILAAGPAGGGGDYGLRQQASQLISQVNGTDEVNISALLTAYRANHVIKPPIAEIQNNGGLTAVNQVDGAAAQGGTLLNAPVAGNPAFWIQVSINGTPRHIPCW